MSKKEVRIGPGLRPVLMTFPIYRKHELAAFTIYSRIDEDLSATSITLAKSGKIYGVEFEEAYLFDDSPISYHLGLGIYGSSAEEFRTIVDQLKAALSRVSSAGSLL